MLFNAENTAWLGFELGTTGRIELDIHLLEMVLCITVIIALSQVLCRTFEDCLQPRMDFLARQHFFHKPFPKFVSQWFGSQHQPRMHGKATCIHVHSFTEWVNSGIYDVLS